MFLIYGSKITAASRGFPATARLSCFYYAEFSIQEHKLFLPVESYCHISKKVRINQQLLLSNSTKLNCPNAAVKHKDTAQFSQSKPSSRPTQHFIISDKHAFQVTAACYCVCHTQKNTLHVKPVMLVRIQSPLQQEPTSCK